MSEDKIRIGMIGMGFYAITAHVPALRDTGQVEIAAISRRNPKALADAKEALDVEGAYADWHDLLDRSDLDAIVVSTAHHAHAEPTIAALQQGYPVLVEKPMAVTSEDARAMVEAAQQANRLLAVGYNRRSQGCWRAAKQALEQEKATPLCYLLLKLHLKVKVPSLYQRTLFRSKNKFIIKIFQILKNI